MKMSITQALAELKLLDARIHRGVSGAMFCTGYMVNTKINGTLTPAEAESSIASNWQSVNDLIKRRADIKAKIVESNAKTAVEVNGVTMSVAAAIERKGSVQYEQSLLDKMKHDFRSSLGVVTQGNEQARHRAQEALNAVLGKESGKTPSKEDIAAVFDPVYQRYEHKLLDPLGLEKKIAELEEGIDGFLSNVDFSLSTSNALTTIEVE